MTSMPPWPPYLDADANKFGLQLETLYDEPHGSHVPSGVDYLGWVRWGSEYRFYRAGGLSHDQAWATIRQTILGIWGEVVPVPPDPPVPDPGVGYVKQLKGYTRTAGRSFADDQGPRIFHGCSDFAALVKHQQNRDASLRQLDAIAKHQQYVRVLWRLNGWKWTSSGYTVDPIRDGWFEAVLFDYLQACKQRGLRVNLSSGDMNNWSADQMRFWFRRVAEISKDVSEQVVWLHAVTNEMAGTWAPGETDEHVSFGAELLAIVKEIYPWNHHAISDPASQDGPGMKRMSPGPADCALIHNTRYLGGPNISDAIRRAFNIMYEGYPPEKGGPGKPIVEDEPTGPNGQTVGPWGQNVYQPYQKPEELFALYTQHVLVGCASTGFNDASLLSAKNGERLETLWGFKELPKLWHVDMEIPEDIGQGTLHHGGMSTAPLRVGESGEGHRADSVIAPGGKLAFGIIHGGHDWSVTSTWDADAVFYGPTGAISGRSVRAGEVLIETDGGGHPPVVVRLTR